MKPYGKYLPFLLASAEGGMLGYALYGLIVGSQSGFAAVDLGQTVFAYTVWLGCLTSVDGEKVDAKALLKNMFSNKCFLGMALGILCVIDCFGVITVALTVVGVALIYDGLSDLWIISRVNKTAKSILAQAKAVDSEILEEEDI